MGVMPTPKPLTPEEARATLVHRWTLKADRYRQFNTKFGLRPYRVFLVWDHWDGEFRGEGNETVRAEVELLPTPRITGLSGNSLRPYSHGTFPEGSLRVDRISAGQYTDDMLEGLVIPTPEQRGCMAPVCGPVRPLNGEDINASGIPPVELTTDVQTDFWWEIREDGRGANPPKRRRYRVMGSPERESGKLQYVVTLERASEPLNRTGEPQEEGVDQAQRNDQLDDGSLSLQQPVYLPE